MPLTAKGTEILHSMQKQYGTERGESIFYASKNKGTITGVDRADMTSAEFSELERLFSEFMEEERGEAEHADSRINSGEKETFFVVKDGRKISGEIDDYKSAVQRAKQTKGAHVENDEGEVEWQPRADAWGSRLDAALAATSALMDRMDAVEKGCADADRKPTSEDIAHWKKLAAEYKRDGARLANKLDARGAQIAGEYERYFNALIKGTQKPAPGDWKDYNPRKDDQSRAEQLQRLETKRNFLEGSIAHHNAEARREKVEEAEGELERVNDELGKLAGDEKKSDADGVRIVYNKLLGGWYVVRGPHQTPLSGRFSSKEEAQAWLKRRGDTAWESGLKEDEPRVVSGVKGVKSKPFTKRFRNHAAMERWMDSPEAEDYEVQRVERE